jgi:AraC-like DNA-binding protein
MLDQELAFTSDQSALQYGFKFETKHYVEKQIRYHDQNMLFYQFSTSTENGEIRVVPDGCIDILIECDDSNPHAVLYGTFLQGDKILLQSNQNYFGVRFTTQQSMNLSSVPFRDVVNQNISLANFFPDIPDSCYIIAHQQLFEERITTFKQLFLSRLLPQGAHNKTDLVFHTVQHIYRLSGNVSIDRLAEKLGYSSRYIRRKFEQTLGISPKLFCRIVRFQNALALLQGGNTAIIDVVNHLGYFDQSHFLKDFNQFSLLTPTQIQSHYRKDRMRVHPL